MNLKSIKCIVKNCPLLTEVDFGETYLCEESINFLVKNLSTKIEKLRLRFGVRDEHVKILVNRCHKIKSLNLSSCEITNNSLKNIIENLKYTLEELDVSGTNIVQSNLLQLRSVMMPKLRVLKCGKYGFEVFDDFNDFDDFDDSDDSDDSFEDEIQDIDEIDGLKELKELLPHLSINNLLDLEIADIKTGGFYDSWNLMLDSNPTI